MKKYFENFDNINDEDNKKIKKQENLMRQLEIEAISRQTVDLIFTTGVFAVLGTVLGIFFPLSLLFSVPLFLTSLGGAIGSKLLFKYCAKELGISEKELKNKLKNDELEKFLNEKDNENIQFEMFKDNDDIKKIEKQKVEKNTKHPEKDDKNELIK